MSKVTVVTPVYNGERYLAECIESVLAQTYSDWSYFIVNNCSTDRSREIAQGYADRDPRIRIVDNAEFLSQVDNLNRAMALTEPDARYTKMVLADDTLFPRCLSEMVRVGDEHPSAGIIGAWRKDDESINCNELPGPDELFDGKDVGRRCLVDDVFVAGSPNTLMYRADLVRARSPFYPLGTFHEDTELFFELLVDHDFGYVHEPLTFTRRENESLSSTIRMHDYEHRLDKLVVTMKYGPKFLDAEEFAHHREQALEAYYRFLAGRTQFRTAKGFWEHHQRGLRRAGLRLDRGRYLRAWSSTFLRSLLDGSLVRRLWRRLTPASST